MERFLFNGLMIIFEIFERCLLAPSAGKLLNHLGQMCISVGSLGAGDGLDCISDRTGLYLAARLGCQGSEAHRFLQVHLFVYFFFPGVAGRVFNNA